MSLRRQRTLALLVSTVLGFTVFGFAACGVSADRDPQAIAPEDVPFSLLDSDLTPPSTAVSGANGQTATFFLIRSGDDGTFLEAVTRPVASATPSDIVATLLDVQPDEIDPAESGLTNRIPDGTLLLGATLDQEQGLLTLDFSENLLTVEGPAQTSLFAQIVCTATEIQGIDRVSFEIDSEPVNASIDGSALTPDPVSCSDYRSFNTPA